MQRPLPTIFSRLAGNFVVFSPSFDAKASDGTAESGINVAGLIDAVATAIHLAAPRHLIGVHLAGGSAWTDYDQLQGKPWLNMQLFQTGHEDAACLISAADPITSYASFACRSSVIPIALSVHRRYFQRCLRASSRMCHPCHPAKPSRQLSTWKLSMKRSGITRLRVKARHTAWNSGLSGSFGFNIGVYPDITFWSNPLAYASPDHHSDEDLSRMKGLFKSLPWTRAAHPPSHPPH